MKRDLGLLDDLADQREAVGVHAAGLERQHHVSGLDRLAVDELVLLDGADGKASKVILASLIACWRQRRSRMSLICIYYGC